MSQEQISFEKYAHTREGSLDQSEWQLLVEHLQNVAELSASFAETFDSHDWGRLAGLWHDVGKYQAAFQAKLRGEKTSVEHSGLGAAFAIKKNKEMGLPLAFVIGAHHGGLANLIGSSPGQPTPIMDRVKSNQKTLEELLSTIPESISNAALPDLPPHLESTEDSGIGQIKADRRRIEFWIRFLFSALVDADRLDTENYMDSQSRDLRGGYALIGVLRQRLEGFLEKKGAQLSPHRREMPVNKARASVLAACLKASENDCGAFSLTVPTGGGKTLSAMAFALRHAEQHHLRRVVVVIPYTSIIEQNAQEYRLALGSENVIEHHSNLDIEQYRAQHGEEETRRMQLASENWDAPVIVTTTVQFFESLFSNKASQCRKLHNITRSVIILDEVQTLPPEYLVSILDALKELTRLGCSVVLSTATPPALAERERFEWGLKDVREIIPDTDDLSSKLKRVDYFWPDPESPPISWEELADQASRHKQVMAVVHRRDDAREMAKSLHQFLGDSSVLHLSALMCPAHRSQILSDVKHKLSAEHPCRLVSTQLVEAGVDLDFPMVYRALGGLDSMVQAAGRCNREGHLDRGRVIVFRASSKPPPGTPRKAMEIAEGMLRKTGGHLDVSTSDIFEEYFRSLYFGSEMDAMGIQTLRQEFKFADVARSFRLIEDNFTIPIIMPYGQAQARLADFRKNGPSRGGFRGLQPFIVSIYPGAFQTLSS